MVPPTTIVTDPSSEADDPLPSALLPCGNAPVARTRVNPHNPQQPPPATAAGGPTLPHEAGETQCRGPHAAAPLNP